MSAFLSFSEPGFWLVIAVLVGVGVLAGHAFAPRPWRAWLLPAYWIGVPYLALISGAVSPRLMGLRFLDWPLSLRLGAGLVLAVLAAVAVARLFAAADRTEQVPVTQPGPGRWLALLAAIFLCGAEEFYWSFLRGALWELLQSLPQAVELPAYWAIWLAALLALPWAILPQPTASTRLAKVALLLITSVAFLYTRNFWLCWFLHAGAWLLLAPSDRQATKNHEESAVAARTS